MAAMRDVGFDHARTNVNGGACALGHPVGRDRRAHHRHAGARVARTRRRPRHCLVMYRRRRSHRHCGRGALKRRAWECPGGARSLCCARFAQNRNSNEVRRCARRGHGWRLGSRQCRGASHRGGRRPRHVVRRPGRAGPGRGNCARSQCYVCQVRRHLGNRGQRRDGVRARRHGRHQSAGQLRRRHRRGPRARQERADGRRFLHARRAHQPHRHVPVRQGGRRHHADTMRRRPMASAA